MRTFSIACRPRSFSTEANSACAASRCAGFISPSARPCRLRGM
jgi:hypothetical protein